MSKIAFCFLSYADVQQQALWSSFFATASSDRYAVFLHRADGISTSWIPGCTVVPTLPTKWGSFGLVRAQQALFNEAYKDPDIVKCVLLSGDTIPIHTFDTIYAHLTCDDKGYFSMFINPSQLRESSVKRHMWPSDREWCWKKAAQWVVLHRTHIQHLQENWEMLCDVFNTSYIPDEHMYPIFFNSLGLMQTFHNQAIIFVNWSMRSSICSLNHGVVPTTHHIHDLTPAYMDRIYESGCMFLRKICPANPVIIDWTKSKQPTL